MRRGPSGGGKGWCCGSLSPANRSFCSNIIALHKNLLVVLQWVYKLCVGHQPTVGADDADERNNPAIVGPDLSRPAPIYRPRWLFRSPDYCVDLHYWPLSLAGKRPVLADKSAVGAIMAFNTIIGVAGGVPTGR